MTKSETFNPPNKESDLDLAGFLTPIEPAPTTDAASVSSPSSGPQQFPAVFFVHEKITDSVQQVHLALVRLTAVLSGLSEPRTTAMPSSPLTATGCGWHFPRQVPGDGS